jgi:hypothetical protein
MGEATALQALRAQNRHLARFDAVGNPVVPTVLLQGKCLTVIETKRVRRLGAVVEYPMDIKLIAATQVALNGQVLAGRFRADLYHRLAVVVLALPPLRMRGDEILVLARTFLQQYGAAYGVGPQGLSKAAEAWLLGYRWPGNVRELSHLLERVALLETAMVIDPESLEHLCLPQSVPDASAVSMLTPTPGAPLHEIERLADALRQSGGNLAAAARLIGMSRSGLRHRLHKYGLTHPSMQQSSPLVGEEPGGGEPPPPFSTPTLPLPRRGGGETPSQIMRPQDASTGAAESAAGWEPKPVAVLAIEVTWPDIMEADALRYEPWTLAKRWEQRMAEKVAGFGGVILQGSPSLCLVAFGLPRTLEQLPQRAVQVALAIYPPGHRGADLSRTGVRPGGTAGRAFGDTARRRGDRRVPGALAPGGGNGGPAGATTRARGAGGAPGVRVVHETGQHVYEAELHWLKGELLLQQTVGAGFKPAPTDPSMVAGAGAHGHTLLLIEAETCFRQALDIARQQQAKSLELRAAMNLSRLWQRQGRRTDAYQLLAPIYGWFTEGFDTADLQDAKVLLDALT